MRPALPRAKGAEVFTRRHPARGTVLPVTWVPVSTAPERIPVGDIDGPACAGEWAYRVRFALAGTPGAVTNVLVQPCEAWPRPMRPEYRVVAWYSYRLGPLSNPGGGAELRGEPRFPTPAAAEVRAKEVAWDMIRQSPSRTAAAWDFLQFWDGCAWTLDWLEEERRIEMEDREMSPVCEEDDGRPGIIGVGSIYVEDGFLHVDGWAIEDPTRPAGHTRLGAWNCFFGRSVRELHELAHTAACRCPVYGFTPSDGEITLAYDSPVPYTWAA